MRARRCAFRTPFPSPADTSVTATEPGGHRRPVHLTRRPHPRQPSPIGSPPAGGRHDAAGPSRGLAGLADRPRPRSGARRRGAPNAGVRCSRPRLPRRDEAAAAPARRPTGPGSGGTRTRRDGRLRARRVHRRADRPAARGDARQRGRPARRGGDGARRRGAARASGRASRPRTSRARGRRARRGQLRVPAQPPRPRRSGGLRGGGPAGRSGGHRVGGIGLSDRGCRPSRPTSPSCWSGST